MEENTPDFSPPDGASREASGGGRPEGKPWRYEAAAEFLGMSVTHLRRLIKAGKIRPIHLGQNRKALADEEVRRIAREGVQ